MFNLSNSHANGVLLPIGDVSSDDLTFLSENERERYRNTRSETGKRYFLAGRLAAKNTTGLPKEEWQHIDIISKNGDGKGIPPQLFLRGIPLRQALTLAHAGECAAAFLAKEKGIRIGCDIVAEHSVTDVIRHQFFMPEEMPLSPDEVWAVKEAAYKTLCTNEPFMPQRYVVRQTGIGWYCCSGVIAEVCRSGNCIIAFSVI